MKKLFKPLLFLFFAAAITSCSKTEDVVDEQVEEGIRPTSDYEIIPGDDPFTFQFKSKSTNFKALEWRFGDDSLGTAEAPNHVYLGTGVFQVNLKATSESGSTARKLQILTIDPDSVVKLTAVKTGNPNEIQFGIDTKASIGSVSWNFGGESPSTSTTPVVTYPVGTLNPFTLKLTTTKGSVVELSKFGTTEGIVTNVTDLVTTEVSKDNGGGKSANEGSLKIVDNTVDTKLYLPGWGGSWWMQFLFPTPTTIKYYAIGNGNDSPDRDPKVWTLQGSNNGSTWTDLDSRTLDQTFYDQAGGQYKQLFYFSVANPGSYSYYRYNVTANFGSGDFQISEFRLYK